MKQTERELPLQSLHSGRRKVTAEEFEKTENLGKNLNVP